MKLRISPLRKAVGLGALLSALCLTVSMHAASPAPLAGNILGEVRNGTGIVQMGATVLLYNRYDELLHRSLTDERGRFGFADLVPDVYSVRVVLASFMPAERRNIAVLPNSENKLDIHLANVLSTIDLAPMSSGRGALMSDEWKWVLRSSQSTRPILRLLPGQSNSTGVSVRKSMAAAFSNTTGVVKLSAGEGQSITNGFQQDLGTAFAMATSLSGAGRVQFSGNVGYGQNATMPTAGFRTSFTGPGADGFAPQVVLTMRQMSLAPRIGTGITVGAENGPMLRTMSVAFVDHTNVGESVSLDYGFDMQSISYLDRLNYVSPFIRATYDAGTGGRVRMAFSSGSHPVEMLAREEAKSGELDQELAALAFVPRVSLSNARPVVERTQTYEIGYERVQGSRTYTVGAYQESVSNAAFLLSGFGDAASAALIPASDLLPDLSSNGSIFNVGSYRRTGYLASVQQEMGDHFEVAVAAGRTGALLPSGVDSESYSTADDLRAGIRHAQRAWVTVRATAKVSQAGTRITTTYGWTDFNALMPVHVYLTQKQVQDIGWNLYVRQPLPVFNGMPWRLEMTAELRNLLAQGYLPVGGPGSRAVLTNSPRSVRGGLNFIF
jgi:hypothetical protein